MKKNILAIKFYICTTTRGYNMLESICIKSGPNDNRIDFGFLCESILFYGKVRVIVDYRRLRYLFDRMSIRGLERLIKQGRIEVFIAEKHLGAMTFGENKSDKRYAFESIQGVNDNYITELYKAFELTTKDIRKSIKLTNEFCEIVNPFNYSSSLIESLNEDLDNREYIINTMHSYISSNYPEVSISPFDININFTVHPGEDVKKMAGFSKESISVESNLPIDKFLELDRRRGYAGTDFYSGYFLSLLETAGDIDTAAQYSSEIATREIYSNMIRFKVESLYMKNKKSTQELDAFNEYVIKNCHSVAQAINSYKLSFSKFMKILDTSDRFKGWLTESNDDIGLVAEYYKALSTDNSMFSSFPLKHMKFIFFAAAGFFLTPIQGIALGGLDSFFVDKIKNGWKPNQFVDNQLKPSLPKK
ncbi:hypothetical protein ACAW74_16440 [Fibrella sp. WM1]|uniref:hypothetical protein n=1 Tax=Fibrella musci TaxID=3242485 RepID=UPI0035206619